MYSGGHLERVKDPIGLLSAILYLCGVASWGVGDTKYEWKGVENILCVLAFDFL